MKNKIINLSLNLIEKKIQDISYIELMEIKYGLECIYITLTKFILISILAYLLNIFTEMVLLLIFFNILRTTGFGHHASKSSTCIISSIIVFICFPIIAKILVIPLIFKYILGIIGTIMIILYSPADTLKHPIISKKRRIIYKFLTSFNCIVLVILSLIINNEVISNLIIFGIYIEVLLILPFYIN